MNQPSVYQNFAEGRGVLENNILVYGTEANAFLAGSGVNAADVRAYWEANNTTIAGPFSDAIWAQLGLSPDAFYGARLADDYPPNVDFRVTSGLLASGAKFTNAKFNEPNRAGFFDTSVNFIGGFGSVDWTAGWAEFDPVNKEY